MNKYFAYDKGLNGPPINGILREVMNVSDAALIETASVFVLPTCIPFITCIVGDE